MNNVQPITNSISAKKAGGDWGFDCRWCGGRHHHGEPHYVCEDCRHVHSDDEPCVECKRSCGHRDHKRTGCV